MFALFGALPLALSSWYLTPVLLAPAAVGLWAVRAGVDVSPTGLVIRGALGTRRLVWDEVAGFTAVGRRVLADLSGGSSIALPAVRPPDVPRLVTAGGQRIDDSHGTGGDPVTLAT